MVLMSGRVLLAALLSDRVNCDLTTSSCIATLKTSMRKQEKLVSCRYHILSWSEVLFSPQIKCLLACVILSVLAASNLEVFIYDSIMEVKCKKFGGKILNYILLVSGK